MTGELLLTMLGNYAFPIVACAVMAWYVKYITDKNHIELQAVREEHEKEMEKVTEAVNNNTLAVTKLITMLEVKLND